MFSSVPVLDVTTDNLSEVLPSLRVAVQSASFVAVDCVSDEHGLKYGRGALENNEPRKGLSLRLDCLMPLETLVPNLGP